MVHDHGERLSLPRYSVFKVMWYRDNQPDIFRKTHKLLGSQGLRQLPDDSGEAPHRLLLRVGERGLRLKKWDFAPKFFEAGRHPPELFPEIVPSTHVVGELTKEAAGDLGLPRKVKVICGGGAHNSCMALGARKHRRRARVHLARFFFLDRRLLGRAGPRLRNAALRFHPRRPGDVHLGGEHLRGGELTRVGEGHPLPGPRALGRRRDGGLIRGQAGEREVKTRGRS